VHKSLTVGTEVVAEPPQGARPFVSGYSMELLGYDLLGK
jgi:hypothetical protein